MDIGPAGRLVGCPAERAVTVRDIVCNDFAVRVEADDAVQAERATDNVLGEPLDGDTLFCKGKVTGKSEKDGKYLVECEIWMENSKGEVNTSGTATVSLPSKK